MGRITGYYRRSNFDAKAHEANVKAMKAETLRRLKKQFGEVKTEKENWYENATYVIGGRRIPMYFKKWGNDGYVQVTMGWSRNHSPFVLRSKTVEGLDFDRIIQGIATEIERQVARSEQEAEDDRVRDEVMKALEPHGYGDDGLHHATENDCSVASYDVQDDGEIHLNVRIDHNDVQRFLDLMKLFPEKDK